MASDEQKPKAQGSAGARRRPPPTIDLGATEVAVEDKKADKAEDKAGDTPPGAPPPPEAAAETATQEASQSDAPQAEPAPPPEPEPQPDPPPPPPPLPPRASWLMGAVAGAIAAMLVVFALYALGLPPQPTPPVAPDTSALQARVAALEARVAARPAADPRALDDIAARLAKVESAVAAPQAATDPAVAGRLNSLEVAVKSTGDTVASLNGRVDDLSAAVRDARDRAEAAAKGLVDRQRDDAADKGATDALAARLAALEQKVETPGSTAADRDVRRAVLASALKDAVMRGAPYATELGAMKPLIADQDTLSKLEASAAAGAPSDAALARALAAVVPALRDAATPPRPQGGSIVDRLQASAERLVRIRPADEPAGDDPQSIVARIDDDARRADIPAALADLARLPAAVRAPAEPWIATVKARDAARAAALDVAAQALGGLAAAAH